MRMDRWNWLDHGLLPLLLFTMRAAWLWPWLALLHAWTSPTQTAPVWPFAVLVGLPFLSYTLTRSLAPESQRKQDTNGLSSGALWTRLAIAAGGILTLLLLLWVHFYRQQFPLWQTSWLMAVGNRLTHWGIELPVEILAIAAGVYLWLRGVLDARSALHHEDVWRAFGTGAVALALAFWLAQVGNAPLAGAAAVGMRWLLLYFACGMAALAVTNLKTASGWSLFGRSGPEGGRPLHGDRYWLLSIAATIGGLLVLGLLIGSVVAPEHVAWLLNGIGLVLSLLGRLLYFVVVAVSYVFFALAYGLYWLLRPLVQGLLGEEQSESELQLPEPLATPEAAPPQMADPATIPEPYRWIALAVVVLGIFFLFVLVLRRLAVQDEEEAEEVRESIYSSDLLQDQLAALWKRLRGRLQGSAQGRSDDPAFADLSGEAGTRRTIRAVYQHLLATSAGRGVPRAAAQTPLEYQSDLEQSLIPADRQLQVITNGYLAARYALQPPPQATAQQVQAAWTQIEEQINRADDEA